MHPKEKSALVAGLRAQIATLETPARLEPGARFTLGLEAVDTRLPGGGLARCGVHEVTARTYGDMGVAIGFAAALAARAAQTVSGKDGLIVWCQQGWGAYDLGSLYGPGLASFGVDPSRLLLVNPAREPDMLWALEECVRAGVFGVVVGEISATSRHFNLRASRRLHLGAEDTGTPLILLRGHGEMFSPSAALTRWKISAASAGEEGLRHMATSACWQVELEKCKGGQPFSLPLSWDASVCVFAEARLVQPRRSATKPAKVSASMDSGSADAVVPKARKGHAVHF